MGGHRRCKLRKKYKKGANRDGAVGYPAYLMLYWEDYKYRSGGGRDKTRLSTYKNGNSRGGSHSWNHIPLGEVDFMRKNEAIEFQEKGSRR